MLLCLHRIFRIMGLVKQIEFAQKCGIGRNNINVYKKRGKILVDADGYIDEQNPLNAAFLEKCLKKPRKEPKVPVVEITTSIPEKPQKAQITEKKSKEEKYTKYDRQLDLSLEKKQMEIAKMERDARLADMEHEKALGKLVPTDPVKSLFMHTIKSFTMAFKQESEKIINEFSKRYKMNRNDAAEMREQLVALINRAAEDGIMESKKAVSTIVREYSQAKNV